MGVTGAEHHPALGGRHTALLDDVLRWLEHSPWFEPLGTPATRDHAVFRSYVRDDARLPQTLAGLQCLVAALLMRAPVVAALVQQPRASGIGP